MAYNFTDPGYDLIFACLAALKADANVFGVVGERIYVGIAPPSTEAPYIVVGPSTMIREDGVDLESQNISLQVHLWSWGYGEQQNSVLVRRLSTYVSDVLHNASLSLGLNDLVSLEHRGTQIFEDADGIKDHGVLDVWASVERP